jgi:Thermophilic metalloprotease (M29)
VGASRESLLLRSDRRGPTFVAIQWRDVCLQTDRYLCVLLAMNLQKLFIDVFDPQPGEVAAIIVDLPRHELTDNDEWQARRMMAERWRSELSHLARERTFTVLPLITFDATGLNNAQLPAGAIRAGVRFPFEELGAEATLLLAMTEFSASAPLIGWTNRLPNLRVASMPRVAPRMESTALAADYKHVARSCARLRDRLCSTCFADFQFSTGERFRFDFRFRQPQVDDGHLPPSAAPPRLINLPSGEAFVAAYEGEKNGPSLTGGILPLPWDGGIVRARVHQNRVEEVIGDDGAARTLRDFLFADPGRRNVAELGLGCNPFAQVTGNVLEDEKAGPHIALGRSEHLGGTVGPEAFNHPSKVWHEDFVYARGCAIQIDRLTLVDDDGRSELLFAKGSYASDLEIGI